MTASGPYLSRLFLKDMDAYGELQVGKTKPFLEIDKLKFLKNIDLKHYGRFQYIEVLLYQKQARRN